MATSCLSGTFLALYLEGLNDLSYLSPSLILLQSFLRSSGLKSTLFLEIILGELGSFLLGLFSFDETFKETLLFELLTAGVVLIMLVTFLI